MLKQPGVCVLCISREGRARGGDRKCAVCWAGDAPGFGFEAACKLVVLFVVAEGGSPGPLCPSSPAQAPQGCSCQVVGSNEPLSHPGALPSCQGAGLAPKVLHGSWELAGIADGPASPWWRLPTSPRVQASWPRTCQTALARRRSLGHPAPPTPWLTRARSLLGVPAVFTTETPLVDMRSCS